MTASLEHAERISAFVDGELSASEVDALLDSLENPACRGQLARFARQGRRGCPDIDISAAVAARIRQEQAPVRNRQVRVSPLLLPFRWRPSARTWVAASGFAAAASVAVVALNIAPATQQVDSVAAIPEIAADALTTPAALAARPVLVNASQSQVASTLGDAGSSAPRELVIPVPEQRTELEQLYLQHARFRGGYALASPVSYGRVGASVAALPEAADSGN